MTYSVWCAGELLGEHGDMGEALRVCLREARTRKKACEVRGERGVVLGACIPDSLSAAEAMRQARRMDHYVMTGPVGVDPVHVFTLADPESAGLP